MNLPELNNKEDLDLLRTNLSTKGLKIALGRVYSFFKEINGSDAIFLSFLIKISKEENKEEFNNFVNIASGVTENSLKNIILEMKEIIPRIVENKRKKIHRENKTDNKISIVNRLSRIYKLNYQDVIDILDTLEIDPEELNIEFQGRHTDKYIIKMISNYNSGIIESLESISDTYIKK